MILDELGEIRHDSSSESMLSASSAQFEKIYRPNIDPIYRNRAKRIFDIIVSMALIIFLIPVFILIIVLVKADGGSAFFAHRRIGAGGNLFHCLKFRSMVVDADRVLARILEADPEARAEWESDFKLRSDPRVTSIGRFLRKASLDELPQLFNVLAGEMSLVGPRPIVEAEMERYEAALLDYCRCRPGITGLWQVSGRNDRAYRDRVSLDRFYARSWSFRLDIQILLKTVVVVTRRQGSY